MENFEDAGEFRFLGTEKDGESAPKCATSLHEILSKNKIWEGDPYL